MKSIIRKIMTKKSLSKICHLGVESRSSERKLEIKSPYTLLK